MINTQRTNAYSQASEQETDMPRAYIKYDSDGIEEWDSVEMFGDTIELIT